MSQCDSLLFENFPSQTNKSETFMSQTSVIGAFISQTAICFKTEAEQHQPDPGPW